MLSRRALRSALLAVAGLGCIGLLAPAAFANPISGLSITNNTTLAYGSGPPTGAGGDQNAVQGAQILANDPTGFSTRFFTTGAADRPIILAFNPGTASAQTNMNYTITFTVTVANGLPYFIDVASSLLGAVTAVDDQLLIGSGGNATVGNLNGGLTGPGFLQTPGTLSLLGSSASGTTSTVNNVSVSRSNLAQIIGVGTGLPQVYSLNFTATFNANSPRSASGGDEHAYRFGLASSATGSVLNGASADDYAGEGNRNGLNDGHFVSASITIVPEPGTLLLLGAGIAGLAHLGRRRTS